jgi:hypothetical protein
MPLTFAHPLAAVPFARRGLPLSALAVGAMSPDFVYFLMLVPGHQLGHSLGGIVLWDLPLSLLVLWMFHRLIKRPLAELLPTPLQARLAPWVRPFPWLPARRFAALVGAILLGAVTHLAWDAFTHHDRAVVVHWSLLRRTVELGSLGAVPVYKLLQHGSTVVGLALLGLWLARVLARTQPIAVEPRLASHQRGLRLAGLVLISLAAGIAWASLTTPASPHAVQFFLGRWIVATTTAAFLLASLYGLGVRAAESGRSISRTGANDEHSTHHRTSPR